MTPNDYIEAEGATVEQAIREALATLAECSSRLLVGCPWRERRRG